MDFHLHLLEEVLSSFIFDVKNKRYPSKKGLVLVFLLDFINC